MLNSTINYQVSGTAIAWDSLCLNIVNQATLFNQKLKNSSDVTKATEKAFETQAHYQYEQLQDKKEELICQGASSIAAGTTAAAIELVSIGYSFKMDRDADALEKPSSAAKVDLSEIAPSSSSTNPASSTTSSTSKSTESVTLDKQQPTIASTTPAAPKTNIIAEKAQDNVIADQSASLVTNGRSNVQTEETTQNLNSAATKESIAKDNQTKATQFRKQADALRTGAGPLGQAISSIIQGIGALGQSYWTNEESSDTMLATLAQGAEQILQTILQQIQAMMQAADTSQQGTLSTFSSIIAANVIRG